MTLFRIQSLPTTVKHYSSSLILFFISYLDYEMGCLHESYHQQVIFMHGLVLHPCSFPDISFELLNLCRECKFAGRVLESGHLSFFFLCTSDQIVPRQEPKEVIFLHLAQSSMSQMKPIAIFLPNDCSQAIQVFLSSFCT